MLNVHTTSSAVTGLPSANRASGRISNAIVSPSAASVTLFARCPYPVATSSADPTISDSHTCPPTLPDAVPPTPGCHRSPTPIAAFPRKM